MSSWMRVAISGAVDFVVTLGGGKGFFGFALDFPLDAPADFSRGAVGVSPFGVPPGTNAGASALKPSGTPFSSNRCPASPSASAPASRPGRVNRPWNLRPEFNTPVSASLARPWRRLRPPPPPPPPPLRPPVLGPLRGRGSTLVPAVGVCCAVSESTCDCDGACVCGCESVCVCRGAPRLPRPLPPRRGFLGRGEVPSGIATGASAIVEGRKFDALFGALMRFSMVE